MDQIKAFDKKLKRYKQLLPSMRYYMKHGITERNSFNFFILLDEFVDCYEHVNKRYHMKPKPATLEFVNSYL